MFKYTSFLLVMLASLYSCADTSSSSKSVFEGDNNYKFQGTYYGILPCEDCLGIETTLTLRLDSSFSESITYLDSTESSKTLKGNIVFIKSDIFLLRFKDSMSDQNFKILSDSLIMALDDRFNLIEESNAGAYQLKQIKELNSDDLNGIYINSDTAGDYYQILNIQNTEDEEYDVLISFKGAKKGCNFEGVGKLVNNQINLNLSKIQGNMKSTMIVRFKDRTAHIFTAKFEDRYDLMHFCDGDGSLAGEYVKQGNVQPKVSE